MAGLDPKYMENNIFIKQNHKNNIIPIILLFTFIYMLILAILNILSYTGDNILTFGTFDPSSFIPYIAFLTFVIGFLLEKYQHYNRLRYFSHLLTTITFPIGIYALLSNAHLNVVPITM